VLLQAFIGNPTCILEQQESCSLLLLDAQRIILIPLFEKNKNKETFKHSHFLLFRFFLSFVFMDGVKYYYGERRCYSDTYNWARADVEVI